jgi:sulfite reductase (NADPH) hemoprotein beta-component
MYRYDGYDSKMLEERVRQFRGQTQRYLDGSLSDSEFLPLRLQNGLYVQRLAPMLRIAIPYGMLNATQLRKLAFISSHYDKGYGHFTTRQNIQFNWPALEDVPELLEHLAEVEMHAIQTSGNCIRNTTTDQFAGVAANELEDSRPYCEIIRQWSTFHPEFAYLPRKFKIAVCGTEEDQAATQVHDIGIYLKRNDSGEIGFQILAGGGLGRTPVIGQVVFEHVEKCDLLSALEAILRVYNREGRRDNKYKARIKILVRETGLEAFKAKVFAEWDKLRGGALTLTDAEIARCKGYFQDPAYENCGDAPHELTDALARDVMFASWHSNNVSPHKRPGYAAVTVSFKKTGYAPGDVSEEQLGLLADLAERYSFGEVRITHNQNVVLADVPQTRLFELYSSLAAGALEADNLNSLNDIICCPGGDFCALANAKSIPIAEAIQRKFDDRGLLADIGEVSLNISGCMNACGHHHVGNIGILGVDKKGAEFYQVSLGGSSKRQAALGKILGPSFAQEEIPEVIADVIAVYRDQKTPGESFLETVQRTGLNPFKARVYSKD